MLTLRATALAVPVRTSIWFISIYFVAIHFFKCAPQLKIAEKLPKVPISILQGSSLFKVIDVHIVSYNTLFATSVEHK